MLSNRDESPLRQQHARELPNVQNSSVFKEGILDEDLEPSTDDGNTESTALFTEYTGTGASWAATSNSYTATNRDDGLRMVSGSYILCVKINGEYRPIGSCDPRNEFWAFDMIGGETGGTFDVTFSIDGTEDTITIDYDATAAEVKTAFETHSEIAVNDVTIYGTAFPNTTIIVEFKNNLAAKEIAIPVIDRTNLEPAAGSGIVFSRYPGSPN